MGMGIAAWHVTVHLRLDTDGVFVMRPCWAAVWSKLWRKASLLGYATWIQCWSPYMGVIGCIPDTLILGACVQHLERGASAE